MEIGLKKEILIQEGWAFQFNNDFYPDVDDTALVGMFLDRYNKEKNLNLLNWQLKEQENGLFQYNQIMVDGERSILITPIIV